ncbi:MAG: hypothetical protein HGA44_19335, partial [Cellulomonadaceae bacterium]|nr:hypothetical protein [Cellulomonadaceae bacterium]
LNTDAAVYGGSGVGNLGRIEAQHHQQHAQAWSAEIRVPPLGTLMFVPEEQ